MTSDLEEFQKAHGQQWGKILGMSSFNAGMIHLSVTELERIKNLSDDEITQNSVTILADLRGKLRHADALLSLPILVDKSAEGDIPEEYVNSVDEHFKEHQRQQSKSKLP